MNIGIITFELNPIRVNMTNGRNSGSVDYYVASEGIYYDHIPLKETYNRIACDNSKFM